MQFIQNSSFGNDSPLRNSREPPFIFLEYFFINRFWSIERSQYRYGNWLHDPTSVSMGNEAKNVQLCANITCSAVGAGFIEPRSLSLFTIIRSTKQIQRKVLRSFMRYLFQLFLFVRHLFLSSGSFSLLREDYVPARNSFNVCDHLERYHHYEIDYKDKNLGHRLIS